MCICIYFFNGLVVELWVILARRIIYNIFIQRIVPYKQIARALINIRITPTYLFIALFAAVGMIHTLVVVIFTYMGRHKYPVMFDSTRTPAALFQIMNVR